MSLSLKHFTVVRKCIQTFLKTTTIAVQIEKENSDRLHDRRFVWPAHLVINMELTQSTLRESLENTPYFEDVRRYRLNLKTICNGLEIVNTLP